MAVTINLNSEVEASLAAQARVRGIALSEYVERLLHDQVFPKSCSDLSPAERASAWREATRNLPHTPPLSDAAISRESIYGDPG